MDSTIASLSMSLVIFHALRGYQVRIGHGKTTVFKQPASRLAANEGS